MKDKALTIRVPEDLHVKMKVKTAKENTTLKDYIIGLVEEDLKK